MISQHSFDQAGKADTFSSNELKYKIIKASAGSGKTYTIVDKLHDLIVAGADGVQVQPSEIIATTFTVKAATELSTRIREKLLEAGHVEQATALSSALIGTVNSITGSILQQFALEARLSPDLTVLDEEAQASAYSAATAAIMSKADREHRALLMRMGYGIFDRNTTIYDHGNRNWGQTVKSLVDLARTNDMSSCRFPAFKDSSCDEILSTLDDVTGNQAITGREGDDSRRIIADLAKELYDLLQDKLANNEIKRRSVQGVEENIVHLKAFTEQYTSPEQRASASWRMWFKTADAIFPSFTKCPAPFKNEFANIVKGVKHTSKEGKLDDWREDAKLRIESLIATDPAFRKDIVDLINVVFDTARECLEAYQVHKEKLGLIDFIDQEELTLRLLDQRPEVCLALKAQYRVLVVDEFQDTSPIQLAVFTKLAELVDEVIWVGDPKQSIYGFRGSDPALMDAAIKTISATGADAEVLRHSWRSFKKPLELTNTIFSPIFSPSQLHSDPDVMLTIPVEHEETHKGGEVAVWWVSTEQEEKRSKERWYQSVADQVGKEWRRERGEGDPKSWAVLTRTNKDADEVRSLLRADGVPCLGGGTPLLETREGATLAAGMAWLIDPADKQALIDLIMVMREHPASADWLEQLAKLPDSEQRRNKLSEWERDPSLKQVRQLRRRLAQLSVREVVAELADALDLRQRVAEWGDAGQRTGAIAGMLSAAQRYLDQADSRHESATVAGFLRLLDSDNSSLQELTTLDRASSVASMNAVTVTTVHKAKGLEWDCVVVMLADENDKFKPAGTWVRPADHMRLKTPLAGRELRFWPETILDCAAITKSAERSQRDRHDQEELEKQRLLYVALTRAKSRIVLAPECDMKNSSIFESSRLSADRNERVSFKLTLEDPDNSQGKVILEHAKSYLETDASNLVYVDPVCVECTVVDIAANKDNAGTQAAQLSASSVENIAPTVFDPYEWIDAGRASSVGLQTAANAMRPDDPIAVTHLPATFTASGVKSSSSAPEAAQISLVAEFDAPAPLQSGRGSAEIGDCVHAYLAAPLTRLQPTQKQAVAQRLIAAWGVAQQLTPARLVEYGDRWATWLEQAYPGARVETEVPITWRNSQHQRMQGWIDQLVTTVNGDRIIVDHKTYGGDDPSGHIRANFIGQLATYRDALTATMRTNQPDSPTQQVKLLIHLPMLCQVMEVTLPDHDDAQVVPVALPVDIVASPGLGSVVDGKVLPPLVV